MSEVFPSRPLTHIQALQSQQSPVTSKRWKDS